MYKYTIICVFSAGCDDVEVKGARYQTSREGTYKESSLTCNGRPVYRQESRYAPNYMFYLNELTGWQGWMIGRHQKTRGSGLMLV